MRTQRDTKQQVNHKSGVWRPHRYDGETRARMLNWAIRQLVTNWSVDAPAHRPDRRITLPLGRADYTL